MASDNESGGLTEASTGEQQENKADGTEGDGLSTPIHDARWAQAFRAQASEELRSKAIAFARRRARIVESYGGRGDAAYAEEVVQDVLTDTWLGTLAWDPERASLELHVEGAIRQRTGHEWRRARRAPTQALEVLGPAEMREVEDALATTASPGPETCIMLVQMVALLHEFAAGDADVLAVLRAHCGGYTAREDLVQAAGLTRRSYRAARRRLDEMLQALPSAFADLLPTARTARPTGVAGQVPAAEATGAVPLAAAAIDHEHRARAVRPMHFRTIRARPRSLDAATEAARKK